MLSIRLDEQTEARLQAACRRLGLSKSEAVKRSLEQWLDTFEPAPNAFDLGADLFDQGAAAAPPHGSTTPPDLGTLACQAPCRLTPGS